MNLLSLQHSEQVLLALRELYDQHGYARYKMNKFEEYDLYARNKDFLISDGVITFTDTNGRLMALKPDVTLSIVKNTKDLPDTVQKLYYNENVYRVSRGTHNFQEIMQVGLEAIGSIDRFSIFEVLKLAAQSLTCTGRRCVLEISHLGLLSELLCTCGISTAESGQALHYLGEKNLHELRSFCNALGVAEEKTALLLSVAALSGTPDEVLPQLRTLCEGAVSADTMQEFLQVVNALNTAQRKQMLRIDFSVVSDPQYYNGFVFKGFAEGLPSSILSGGQYDTLMRKMNRHSGAIGFAVYFDQLEQLDHARAEYDVENLLLYDGTADFAVLEAEAQQRIAAGESVLLQRQIPPDIRYRRLLKFVNGEVTTIEDHA